MRPFFALLFFFLNLLSIPKTLGWEVSPWLPPVFEFQSRSTYIYRRNREVTTPQENFHSFNDVHSLRSSLGLSFWPSWNAEAEIRLSHAKEIDFAFESGRLSLRHALLDDIIGDPVSLTIGISTYFAASRFLKNFAFPYHGNLNIELHAAIGKERSCGNDWSSRKFTYGAIGLANKGFPWLHFLSAYEKRFSLLSSGGLYVDALFGLGDKNICIDTSFNGYADINHRNINLGAYYTRQVGVLGSLTLGLWYMPYSRNFIQNEVGAIASFLIPFSL